MRRVVLTVAVGLAVWTLLLASAGADTYPPVPDKTATTFASQSPPVVVVEGPPAPRRGLVRTGFSGVLPLAAVSAGAIVLGATVVILTRRRRATG